MQQTFKESHKQKANRKRQSEGDCLERKEITLEMEENLEGTYLMTLQLVEDIVSTELKQYITRMKQKTRQNIQIFKIQLK